MTIQGDLAPAPYFSRSVRAQRENQIHRMGSNRPFAANCMNGSCADKPVVRKNSGGLVVRKKPQEKWFLTNFEWQAALFCTLPAPYGRPSVTAFGYAAAARHKQLARIGMSARAMA